MILSAISLWKKFNTGLVLNASEWGFEDKDNGKFHHVTYHGHEAKDGRVRVYARFARPHGKDKTPAVLLLPDVGKTYDEELMGYFLDRGYAVLMPDYSGKMSTDSEGVMRTIYPSSLSYGNYEKAQGLFSMENTTPDKTTWIEWAYVALYSLKYLKERQDISNVGIVGVRMGGEIAWHAMLSPDVKCGVPINATGWNSFMSIAKFGDNVKQNLNDATRAHIAAVEAQSYAPYVKCPVLMLCALRDDRFDCDRAYDTYSRIGGKEDHALVYSPESGACIGPNGLFDMDLFLERNLKGREIYIPETLNVTIGEGENGLDITVHCDKEGLLEEAGVYYAEADVNTKPAYREWRQIAKIDGRSVKNSTAHCTVKPFAGASAVFVYAYAKYINGFKVMSKIVSKRLTNVQKNAVKSRMLFQGKGMDTFGVAQHEDYSIGGIFLEREAIPKKVIGYGGIYGAYSVGGIKTYKISSPRYIPDENAFLEFDAYSAVSQELKISIEVADMGAGSELYSCEVPIKGGGKWKRMILKAADFKGEKSGMPLTNFYKGSALLFDCAGEETEFAITNILWL
ncbi:MAG: hypothetical protein E7364_07335 [Clostridiales bacterium]|nr:hypothetical protein [Clostridiales bacterium]